MDLVGQAREHVRIGGGRSRDSDISGRMYSELISYDKAAIANVVAVTTSKKRPPRESPLWLYGHARSQREGFISETLRGKGNAKDRTW